jgi:long-chain acyl-CoA synthetase
MRLLRTTFFEVVLRPLVWLLAKPTLRRAPSSGTLEASAPLILVANHVTAYDVPLLLYALPFPLRSRIAVAAAGEMMEDWRQRRSHPLGPAIYWAAHRPVQHLPAPTQP